MKVWFGPFTLNNGTRQLTRGDDPLHLSPKAFDLLASLVAARPDVVSKADLQQRLWPDTFVAEANLSNLVAEIRHVLEDSSSQPRYVRTVHRFGYAFCAGASTAPPPAPDSQRCWIEWGALRFSLPPGEYVVGRDPDAAIRMDAATVSRRHARIVVDRDGARLEDLGSKNGTFHRDRRVVEPVTLRSGDAIRIGSQRATFQMRAGDSTETHVEPGR
jgi:DNA-binding winged helix-turn-helix (wHTH) protein